MNAIQTGCQMARNLPAGTKLHMDDYERRETVFAEVHHRQDGASVNIDTFDSISLSLTDFRCLEINFHDQDGVVTRQVTITQPNQEPMEVPADLGHLPEQVTANEKEVLALWNLTPDWIQAG